MKRLTIFLCSSFLFCGSVLFAQNVDFDPFYWNTYSVLNPAYSGVDNSIFLNAQGYSNQGFTDYDGQPTDRLPYSMTAIADIKVKKLQGAIGLNYNQFNNYENTSRTLKLNYNFQIAFNENHLLSAGLSAGIDHWRSFRDLEEQFGGSGRYQGAIAPLYYDYRKSDVNTTLAVFGTGLVYNYKRLHIGVSMTNHANAELVYEEFPGNIIQEDWQPFRSQLFHYYFDHRFNMARWLEFKYALAYSGEHAHRFGYGVMANFNLIFFETLLIGYQGVSDNNRGTNWIMAGLQVANRFQLNYATNLHDNTEYAGLKHEFGLAYQIK